MQKKLVRWFGMLAFIYYYIIWTILMDVHGQIHIQGRIVQHSYCRQLITFNVSLHQWIIILSLAWPLLTDDYIHASKCILISFNFHQDRSNVLVSAFVNGDWPISQALSVQSVPAKGMFHHINKLLRLFRFQYDRKSCGIKKIE